MKIFFALTTTLFLNYAQAAYFCAGDSMNSRLVNEQGQTVQAWSWQPGTMNALATCRCYVKDFTRDNLRCDGDRMVTHLKNQDGKVLASFQYQPGLYNSQSQCRQHLGIKGLMCRWNP